MTTIVTRAGKGSALTWDEGDANFTNLQTAIDDHVADTVGAHAGTAISNTPAGNIVATTVQAAIDELDGQDTTLQTNITTVQTNLDTRTGTTSATGFRNRLINGDMRIDQRNAGAALTINNAAYFYSVDRWQGFGAAADGVFTLQRSTSTPPDGFSHFLRATVTTADASIGATQLYIINQKIEGLNLVDLAWGTSAAKPITLSFRVRSSLTGTFGGSLLNGDANRTYPFTYTINAANTWETKTVTIAGDTTGTWLTDTGIGCFVIFSLGAGSTYLGTAGAWAATQYYGATGQTNVIATLNATWDITGVQFEAGTVATPFELRPYSQELSMCHRYYFRNTPGNSLPFGNSLNYSTTQAYGLIPFPVPMRTAPTALEQNGTAAHYGVIIAGSATTSTSVPTHSSASVYAAAVNFNTGAVLTAGQGSAFYAASASAYLAWSAEL